MEDDFLEQQPDQFDTSRPIIESPAPEPIEPVPLVAMPPGFVPLSGRLKGCE